MLVESLGLFCVLESKVSVFNVRGSRQNGMSIGRYFQCSSNDRALWRPSGITLRSPPGATLRPMV